MKIESQEKEINSRPEVRDLDHTHKAHSTENITSIHHPSGVRSVRTLSASSDNITMKLPLVTSSASPVVCGTSVVNSKLRCDTLISGDGEQGQQLNIHVLKKDEKSENESEDNFERQMGEPMITN